MSAPWYAACPLSKFSLNIDNRVYWCFCHHIKRYIHICLCVFTFWHRYQGFDIVSCSHLMLPRDRRISNTVSVTHQFTLTRTQMMSNILSGERFAPNSERTSTKACHSCEQKSPSPYFFLEYFSNEDENTILFSHCHHYSNKVDTNCPESVTN